MPSYEFTILDAANCDELAPGLSDCYARVRGTVRSPGYWRWRYIDGPEGPSCLVVASYEGRVVGMLGMLYLAFSVRGERVIAALAGDLNIANAHRRWSCYGGMLATPRKSPLYRAVPFSFAFVTGQAAGWAPRLGGVDLGPVPTFTGILDGSRLLEGLRLPRPVALLGGMAAPLCLRIGSRGPGPGLSVRRLAGAVDLAGGGAIGEWRTGAVSLACGPGYLAWRYDACPDADYNVLGAYAEGDLAGFAVFRVEAERRRAYLTELAAPGDRPDVLDALVAASLGHMAQQGVGVVTASFPVWSPQGHALKARGFGLWATPLWAMRLGAFPYSVGPAHPVTRRDAWFFSLGDWLTH